jgi:ATP-dependent DNA helicase RecG
MPPAEELERLMRDLESDRVERKQSDSGDRMREAVCAFANDLPGHRAPGYLFVGVDDAGAPTGLPITDQVLRNLAGMRDDGNILPIPSLVVERVTLAGVPVAVVEVQPSENPPVRFQGRVWIRVGPRRAVASPEEEKRLTERQIASARTFDQRPCPGAAVDEILSEWFRSDYLPRVVSPDVISENRRTLEEQLASLRFFDLRAGRPTHAGILVAGKDPIAFLPGAYVQFVRLDGESMADAILDSQQVTGNLATQLLKLDPLLRVQIRSARGPGPGLRHVESPDYPVAAIRELAFNAVMHRTYEGTSAPVRITWFADRVEIQSPGGLYGQVTPSLFGRVSDYRNPVIGEAMKALGYVEKFGFGITRVKESLKANQNPEPEFDFQPTYVLATVRRRAD